MIVVEKLSFGYEVDRPVLRDLSLTIRPGQVWALTGANGSGKSTLVSLLGGLFPPQSGRIIFNGQTGDDALRALRRRTSLLPQNIDHWLLGETGREDLVLGADIRDPEVASFLGDLIARWNLAELLDQPVERLSLGQKKRLALAAALAKRPLAVFLDEPLAGLDWPGVQTMLADLSRLKEEYAAVVLVTHEPDLLAPLVDHWLLLGGAGLWQSGVGPEIFVRFEEFGVRPIQRQF